MGRMGEPSMMERTEEEARMDLWPHGIQSENASIRVHIDVYHCKAMVFFVEDAIDWMERLGFPISKIIKPSDWVVGGYRFVRDKNGKVTARGIRAKISNSFYIKIHDIDCCAMSDAIGLVRKGMEGEKIFKHNFRQYIVRSAMHAENISGFDYVVKGPFVGSHPIIIHKAQVKYDKRSFTRGVFLQTHENNHAENKL
jgi:hypothetical protein